MDTVLTTLINKEVNQFSPVREFTSYVPKQVSETEVIAAYEPEDPKKIQESLGTVDLWSLGALVRAGINPKFGIKTGLATRLDGVGMISEMEAHAETILAEINTSETASKE